MRTKSLRDGQGTKESDELAQLVFLPDPNPNRSFLKLIYSQNAIIFPCSLSTLSRLFKSVFPPGAFKESEILPRWRVI